jgi:hypothetical protein
MEPADTIRIVVFGNADYSQSRRMLAAAHQVAADRHDVQIDHVDVWQDPERAVAHRVLTVPTTLIVVAGVECSRLSGRRSAHALARAIDHVADSLVNHSHRDERVQLVR